MSVKLDDPDKQKLQALSHSTKEGFMIDVDETNFG